MSGVSYLWIMVLCADLDVGAGQTYSTIGEAVGAAGAGDVIRVHPGTYAEDLDLGKNGPIRIEATEPGMATVQGSIDIDGSDWELADLTIESPSSGDGVQINGDRILIEGVDLSGGTRDGIDGGGTDVTIRGSVIHNFDGGDSDAHCIVLNPGAQNWLIEDNELFDCSGDGVQLFSDGFERTILETTIQRNLIYYTGAINRTENAIDIKNADGLYIRSNVMWGFTDNKTLVFQKGPINVEVTCNEMSDGFTGVEFRGEDGGQVEDVLFAYNLLVGYPEYALKFDDVVGAEVYNNTFVDVEDDGLRFEEESLQGGDHPQQLVGERRVGRRRRGPDGRPQRLLQRQRHPDRLRHRRDGRPDARRRVSPRRREPARRCGRGRGLGVRGRRARHRVGRAGRHAVRRSSRRRRRRVEQRHQR